MADPFSITGSAVGVISLGITVCQGLLRYYRQFKAFGEDISDLMSQIESLDTILKALQDMLKKISVQPEFATDDSMKVVLNTIMRCQQKLQKLEILLEKCAGTATSTSLESRLRLNRLLYPFRQETLTSLMQTIGWLQSNLDTASQMLNISVMAAIQMQMTMIASLSTSASLNSNKILNVAHNINYKQDVSVDKLATIERRLFQLASSNSSNQGRRIPEPATLKRQDQSQDHDHDQDGSLVTKQYLRKLKLKCTCLRPGAAPTASQPVFHRPGCLYSPSSNTVLSVGRRWTIYNWLFKFRVRAFLEITRGSGGCSISPILQFRAITPRDSPAFSLLIGVMRRFREGESAIDTQGTRNQLITMFQDGKASPHDTLEDGSTLLHVVTSGLRGRLEQLEYHNLVASLIEMGVPLDVMDDYGETAVDNILCNYGMGELGVQRATVDLCCYLLNAGGFITSKALRSYPFYWEWLKFTYRVYGGMPMNYSTLVLQEVAPRTGVEDFNLPEELIPLMLRSKDALNLLLKRGVYMQKVFDRYAVWPEGLKCLLQAGYSPGPEAMCRAIESGCKESITLLINSKKFHLGFAELRTLEFHYDPEIAELVVNALADRRRRLQDLAETHLTYNELSELNIRPGNLLGVKAARAFQLLKSKPITLDDIEETSGWLIYGPTHIGLKLAKQLWDAGFRDVDEIDDDGQSPLSRFKPSMSYKDFEAVLEQVTWLVAKGANLDRKISNSPVLHRVATFLGWAFGKERALTRPYNIESRKLIRKVLLDNARDHCHCNCSVGGCTSLDNMLRAFSWPLNKNHTLQLADRIRFFGKILGSTSHDPSAKPFYTEIAPRILRSITFHALGITHTCICGSRPRRRDLDDFKEIQDEQWYLIKQLDDLLDEFITKYSELPDGCLPSFLTEYWGPRMDEVLSNQAQIEEVISGAREIGVVLETTTSETLHIQRR